MANASPFDIPGTANSLADAIRRQAAAQSRAATNKKTQKSGLTATGDNLMSPDPLAQLMEQIQGINTPATPYDVLLQQATGAAGAQFDPLIQQLQGQINQTTKRGKANQAEAKQMYGDLATDIAAQMPEITNQMAAASKEAEGRYDQASQFLQDQYNKQAQDQAGILNQLGIQAANPAASQQAKEDQAYFQGQNKLDENAALQLLSEMKNSDVAYNRQSADNTRLAGVNTAQDIGAQLEDYLQTAGDKMAGLQSSRNSAIQSMLAQLQQQDAERVQDSESQQYNQLMDLFNLQLKMQDMANSAQKTTADDSLFKGTNGPAGASNYLSEIYGSGDTFSSNQIMNAINDVMADPNVIAGKYGSGQKDQYGQPIENKVTDQYMIDLLRRRMQEGDLDPKTSTPLSAPQFSNADINNAINALMAYMGRLK